MALTSAAVLLCSVVALSSACCTPDQWEGYESVVEGYGGRGKQGSLQEYVQVHYDATNHRTAAFVGIVDGEYRNRFKIVTRYNGQGGKLYIVDLKKETCWIKKLDRPFSKACIPDEATPLGDFYLGLDGGFQVSAYLVEGKRAGGSVSVQKLDSGRCIPVGEMVFGKLKGVGFMESVGFINITPGIKNETVFDVPEECEERKDFSLAQELTREHYIMAI